MGILERADPVLKQVKLICTEEGWLLIGKAKNSSGVMEIFCDSIWVAVTWAFIRLFSHLCLCLTYFIPKLLTLK